MSISTKLKHNLTSIVEPWSLGPRIKLEPVHSKSPVIKVSLQLDRWNHNQPGYPVIKANGNPRCLGTNRICLRWKQQTSVPGSLRSMIPIARCHIDRLEY
jgi:hypothetical protein